MYLRYNTECCSLALMLKVHEDNLEKARAVLALSCHSRRTHQPCFKVLHQEVFSNWIFQDCMDVVLP